MKNKSVKEKTFKQVADDFIGWTKQYANFEDFTDKKDISTITCRGCGYRLEIETPLYISTEMTTTCTECYLKELKKVKTI